MFTMDETEFSIVRTPSKVFAKKGRHQVRAATSAERGRNTATTWVNRHIERLIMKMMRRYAKAKQSGGPEDWETLIFFRRFVKQELMLLFVWNTLTVSLTVSTTIPLHHDPLVIGVAGLQ